MVQRRGIHGIAGTRRCALPCGKRKAGEPGSKHCGFFLPSFAEIELFGNSCRRAREEVGKVRKRVSLLQARRHARGTSQRGKSVTADEGKIAMREESLLGDCERNRFGPFALSLEDELDNFPDGAFPTARDGDVIGRALHFHDGICYGHCEPRPLQER